MHAVYRVWLYLHLAAIFGLLLAHGTPVWVAFRLRSERDRVRIRAMLELSYFWVGMAHVFMFLIIITGVVLGFVRAAWGSGWIWTSIGILILLWVAMSILGTRYYDQVRRGVGAEPFYGAKKAAELPPVTPQQLETLLSSPRPIILATLGVGSLLAILWLMMFRPF